MQIRKSILLLAIVLLLRVVEASALSDVNPLIGTAEMGECYPGATVPFGLVQPSPDSRTRDGRRHRNSGYRHTDAVICGFSQTHLSGTGCRGTMDVLIQPFTGAGEAVDFGGLKDFDSEIAHPGYYAVSLTNFGVRAEVTASPRVAHYRWTYEKGRTPRVYLDMMWTWGAVDRWYAPPLGEMSLRIESCGHDFSSDHREVSGRYHVMGWMSRDISFVLRFNRPYKTVTALSRRPGEKAPRYVFDFNAAADEPLEAEIALSYVDLDGARKNLKAEGGRSFAAVRRAAEDLWNDLLSRVDVKGATPVQRRVFYTALYHLFVQPNNIADVDGRYRADGVVGVSRNSDKSFYSAFSLWDTFRAAHPLYTLLIPERVGAFCESLLACARVSGPLPIIPYAGFETGCMVGCHSVPVLADAYLKGLLRGSAADEAFDAIDYTLSHDHPNRPKDANAIIDRYGYIPFDVAALSPKPTPFKASGRRESASRLMEICYDFSAAARMARALGRHGRARYYSERAQLWTNIFDSATGFIRGKDSKGRWREPFDPLLGGYETDFTEASSWVYTWHVLHEPQRLIALMGGADTFGRKLDGLFTAPEGPAYYDGTGRIGQYAHGNEPSHHIAYLYPFVGRSQRTAEIIREVFERFYTDRTDGIIGNEDGGQMSAWYLFSAMGFYPLDPVGGDYVIGAPQFPEITLHRPNGQTLTVVARNISPAAKYVRALSLTPNGTDTPKPITSIVVRHADLLSAKRLTFEMSEQ